MVSKIVMRIKIKALMTVLDNLPKVSLCNHFKQANYQEKQINAKLSSSDMSVNAG